MTVWIGTSGWQYRDWRGRFYPPTLAMGKWLEAYAEGFATVESNAAASAVSRVMNTSDEPGAPSSWCTSTRRAANA